MDLRIDDRNGFDVPRPLPTAKATDPDAMAAALRRAMNRRR